MKAYIHKFFRFIVVAILSVVSVIGGQANLFALPVYAEETVNERVYSAVLDDLKKDTSFNTENYPTKADDYSLQIIQLAESSDIKRNNRISFPRQNMLLICVYGSECT